MLGLKSFRTTKSIISVIEAMLWLKKAASSLGEICPISERIYT